jgi:N-acetylglucosaminyldiphosphoundecaprenol N-acetyl-beta-D-mannosaminyltransferase
MNRRNILNTSVDDITLVDLLEKLRSGGVVYTPNVDHLIKLQSDRQFYDIYKSADYRICDSQILYLAFRFLGQPIAEKISGSDLFPAFYNYYRDDETVRIFLLGASEGVAQVAQDRINQAVGREIIVQSHSPSYGFETNEQECLDIVDLINASGANVLAIGVGAPKQEKWIYHYRDRLTTIQTFLAIGATIDFEAGNVSRAPKWASTMGLEWLYRLVSEPKRLWKRYLIDDLPFLGLLLLQRWGLYRDPFRQDDYGSLATSVQSPIQPAISVADK